MLALPQMKCIVTNIEAIDRTFGKQRSEGGGYLWGYPVFFDFYKIIKIRGLFNVFECRRHHVTNLSSTRQSRSPCSKRSKVFFTSGYPR